MILMVGVSGKMGRMLTNLLSRELGYDSEHVMSGGALADHLRTSEVELILLSMELPENKSSYLLQQLRKSFTLLDLPVIALIRGRSPDRIAEALELGANSCMGTPLNAKVFKARIKVMLQTRRLYQSVCPGSSTMTIMQEKTQEVARLHEHITQGVEESDITQTIQSIYDDDSQDKATPCEFPMLLIIANRSFFSKTIWIGKQSLLAMAFEALPKEMDYQVQIITPDGEPLALDVQETHREIMDEVDAGQMKLHLKINNAPDSYDTFQQTLQAAFQAKGISGVESVFRGEKVAGPLQGKPKSSKVFSLTGGIRYRYQRLLGRGGFAMVYLVEDLTLRRSVAMKVLNRKYAKMDDARNNFLSEAQIAAQFHHPNIIFLYDVGDISGKDFGRYLDFPKDILDKHPERLIYFTMQYVEGQTLNEWRETRVKIKKKEYMEIFWGIAKALEYAHSKGVIHRDIKPDNIMITEGLHTLVADFGIAKLDALQDDPESEITTNGKTMITCTPQYASPEQITGQEMDYRSDIYSFGILMYDVLVGDPPFKSKSMGAMMRMHMEQEPEPICLRNDEVSPALEAFVLKCIAKKPKDRHQNAEEVSQILIEIKGSKNRSRQVTKEEALADLIEEAVEAEDAREASDNLKNMIAYIHSHKTYDDVDYIKKIKSRLSEPSLQHRLVINNLNPEGSHLLFDFYKELSSSAVVFGLLMMFKKEKEPWKKLALAQYAILSSGRNLFPLVLFGLDLPDPEAAIMLASFSDMSYRNQEPIFLKWAEHPGLETQSKLLSMLYALNRSEAETLEILKWFSSGKGTKHEDIKSRAAKMLEEY